MRLAALAAPAPLDLWVVHAHSWSHPHPWPLGPRRLGASGARALGWTWLRSLRSASPWRASLESSPQLGPLAAHASVPLGRARTLHTPGPYPSAPPSLGLHLAALAALSAPFRARPGRAPLESSPQLELLPAPVALGRARTLLVTPALLAAWAQAPGRTSGTRAFGLHLAALAALAAFDQSLSRPPRVWSDAPYGAGGVWARPRRPLPQLEAAAAWGGPLGPQAGAAARAHVARGAWGPPQAAAA